MLEVLRAEETLSAKLPSEKLALKKEEKDDKQGMIVGEFTVKSSEPKIFDETTFFEAFLIRVHYKNYKAREYRISH